MLFTSDKEDKVVSSKNGLIYFKKGKYETDNEDEIESLKNAVGVEYEESILKAKAKTKDK